MKKTFNFINIIEHRIFLCWESGFTSTPRYRTFTGLEATVGYIQKENGEKFMVVETPEGTKLVKVKTSPKELIEKNVK